MIKERIILFKKFIIIYFFVGILNIILFWIFVLSKSFKIL